MKRTFTSIKQTLIFIMMITSLVAMTIMGLSLSIYEYFSLRNSFLETTATSTSIISHNVTAALLFEDKKSATDILSTLKFQPNIILSCIYNRNNQLFSSFSRSGNSIICPSSPGEDGYKINLVQLSFVGPIVEDYKRVGTISIISDLSQLYDSMKVFVIVTVASLIISGILMLTLSARLQRRISGPIIDLANLTIHLSESRNYSLRARKFEKNEIGSLIDGFNEMLNQIQKRDSNLVILNDLIHFERNFLQSILNSMEDAVITLDENFTVTPRNRAAEGILHMRGRAPFSEEWIQTLGLYLPDKTTLYPLELFPLFVAYKGKVVNREDIYVSNPENQRIRWLNIYATGLRDVHGNSIGSVAVITDVTKLRESVEALAASQSQLQAVVDSTTAIIYMKDLDGKYMLVNRHFTRLFGLEGERILGKTDFDIFPAHHAEQYRVNDLRVLSLGKSIEIEEVALIGETTRNFISNKVPLFDRSGRVYAICGVSTDITRQKDQEKLQGFLSHASRILVSDLNYQSTLSAMVNISVPFLSDWCIGIISKEWESDQVSKGFHILVGHPDLVRVARWSNLSSIQIHEIAYLLSVDKIIQNETTILVDHSDSSALVLSTFKKNELFADLGIESLIAVPLKSRNVVFGVLAWVSQDKMRIYRNEDLMVVKELATRASLAVDNALLYEKAKVAIQAREDFLSIAAHELRTPLTPLKLQLELLRQFVDKYLLSRLPPEQLKQIVDSSLSQINRLTTLVDTLLDVSKIRPGGVSLEHKEIDLIQLVTEVIGRYRVEIQKAHLVCKIEAPEKVIGRWDPLRIEEVVTNLLTNAIKYGGQGVVTVSIAVLGNKVRMEFRDQGSGIAKKDQERIFQRFERAVSVLNISGFGLGLYITRVIVEAHGGTITVESEKGKGSVFIVILPLR